MSTEDAAALVAPWGYQYLYNQDTVDATWLFQILETIVLGGYIWDVVISLVPDCEFIFRRRFNYLTILFVVNRIAAIICISGFFVFNVAHPSNCDAINKLTAIAEATCQLTSEALLLVRVWVLYRDKIYVPLFMGAMMFVGPIVDVITWVSVPSSELPGNSGCTFDTFPPSYAYIPFLMQAIFDLMVFLLCTIRILVNSGLTLQDPRKTLNVTKFSEEFLKGGFVYYIPNVIIQIVTIGYIMNPASPIQFVTTSMADAISSAQALRITRSLWKASELPGEASSVMTSHVRSEPGSLSIKSDESQAQSKQASARGNPLATQSIV